MPKLRYVLAVVCYVAIPAVVVAGVALFVLIDPEMARGRASYARDYRLLDAARLGILWASAALALVLWVSCCYLVLTSRRRSLRWLPLAVAGPFGFSVIAALEDRSPTPSDRYQHVIRKLPMHWRVCLEVALLIGVFTSLIVIPLALLFGVTAGYFGKRIDDGVFFVMTVLASVPSLLLLIALIMVLGKGTLHVCLALGVTRKRLRWHYRSRREALIAFSNRHFYDGRLVTFPSADEASHPALRFEKVPDGRFADGVNVVEARRVAILVMEHARTTPDRSLGVIAFSQRQQERILAELDVLRRLVAGASNREIADALYISPRTVQGHLASIFGKLGVGTRAAPWAARRHRVGRGDPPVGHVVGPAAAVPVAVLVASCRIALPPGDGRVHRSSLDLYAPSARGEP